MRTYHDIVTQLAEEYRAEYDRGVAMPYKHIAKKVEMACEIFGIAECEMELDIMNIAHPNHALMMGE